jgi:uncharacterized repeat protein (TIGR04138 family)
MSDQSLQKPNQQNFYQAVEEICLQDTRYKADAYEFVMQALSFTQQKLTRPGHVTAAELLSGIRELIIQQYGVMAKSVLQHWGITQTADFGAIVFAMIEKKMLAKTDTDTLGDFNDVYDFESAFGNVWRDIVIKE